MHIYQGWPNFFMCVTKRFQDTKRAGRRLPTPPYNYLNENKNISCLLLLLFGVHVCYFEGFIAGGFCITELCQNVYFFTEKLRFSVQILLLSEITNNLGSWKLFCCSFCCNLCLLKEPKFYLKDFFFSDSLRCFFPVKKKGLISVM